METMQRLALICCLVFAMTALATEAPASGTSPADAEVLEPAAILKLLAGTWEGNCRTWFEPGKLSDESPIRGTISALPDGSFARHDYRSTILGKPRHGEELIALNTITKRFQIAWYDSFHMNYALMFSEGDATARGFALKGSYDVGQGERPWGWRTVYELIGEDRLIIRSYNVTPDGPEALGVEVDYRRVAP